MPLQSPIAKRGGTAMDALKVMNWATYVLDTMFFIGLTGCASVVVISWISIFKSGFSSRSDDDF
jgi:hypothetical protein